MKTSINHIKTLKTCGEAKAFTDEIQGQQVNPRSTKQDNHTGLQPADTFKSQSKQSVSTRGDVLSARSRSETGRTTTGVVTSKDTTSFFPVDLSVSLKRTTLNYTKMVNARSNFEVDKIFREMGIKRL